MLRSLLVTCALVLVPVTAHAEENDEHDDDGDGDGDDQAMVVVEPPIADPAPESPPAMIVTPRAEVKKWVDVSYASETMLLDGAAVAMFAYGIRGAAVLPHEADQPRSSSPCSAGGAPCGRAREINRRECRGRASRGGCVRRG